VHELEAAQGQEAKPDEAQREIADCDAKLRQHAPRSKQEPTQC
jgi:hypothetical protein